MNLPNIIILATGSPTYHGTRGSTCRSLLEAARDGILKAHVAAVASYHETGSIRRLSDEFQVPFQLIPDPASSTICSWLNQEYRPRYIVLAGYLRILRFVEPVNNIINVHPAIQERFNGSYGSKIHRAVAEALRLGEIKEFGLRFHFVGSKVDTGPTLARLIITPKQPVVAEEIESTIKALEQQLYPVVINAALDGCETWDGRNNLSFHVSDEYFTSMIRQLGIKLW